MMERVFQVCFITGTLFTIVSFALGSVLGSDDADVDFETDTDMDFDAGTDVDFDTDTDVDGDVEIGDDADAGDFSISRIVALRPSTLAAFITVFGGVGMIALKNNLATFKVVAWQMIAGKSGECGNKCTK